ncbi:ATP-dependent helicase [Nonlabens tegetincola]|uniref:DNA 3'-5' helicase n=1 Tax=Nonlabens tegetincola TaxID=323273 RepID=A0A090QKY5_9FLAO|nr:UvrD-helicase domain-containing protein [Nonlabens tegetincola]GAK96186.1 ATP-dependent helicase [Nonlabens tegetincola]
MTHQPTTIYSASAGSGKTYTLARDFLTKLLSQKTNRGYRYILAVTFTNKAVAEMKTRILEYLKELGQAEWSDKIVPIAQHVQSQSGLSEQQLKDKSHRVLQYLLHDYAAFDVVTIDTFNHRLLRTFSKDMKLPDGFQVALDTDELIEKAVNQVIDRAGNDKQLTDILVEYALEKIDNDRSWNIAIDLQKMAKRIGSENNYRYLKDLKNKDISEFVRFRESVKKKIHSLRQSITDGAIEIDSQRLKMGWTINDFSYKSTGAIGQIQKLSDGNWDLKLSSRLLNANEGNLLPKSTRIELTDSFIKLIDDYIPVYKSSMQQLFLLNNIYNSLVPLSLLGVIAREVEKIKDKERLLPIYEFNTLLREQIKDEPAPFIYERLGEKYRHYFIDEFQDTSVMQWQNMQPLIAHAVQSMSVDEQGGTLMLVGDAKQAIYRWRGGDVNQFLQLMSSQELFFSGVNKEPLEFNWRSYDEIVNFNNDFFTFLGNKLQSPVYNELYRNYLTQKTSNKPGGYVQIDILKDDYLDYLDPEKLIPEVSKASSYHVLEQIKHARTAGYLNDEICILVRNNSLASEIARFLELNGERVVSAESMLVSHSPKVAYLVALLNYIASDQPELKYNFLLEHSLNSGTENRHDFINSLMNKSQELIFQELFDQPSLRDELSRRSLYSFVQWLVECTAIMQKQDARLSQFLEMVFEFSSQNQTGLTGLLQHWTTIENKLSLSGSDTTGAIQVMTIHKSKGLEFPVVIVAGCDTKYNDLKRTSEWLRVDPNDFEGFEYLLLSMKEECKQYPDPVPKLYERSLEQEKLDNINVWYVAFTRSVERLYINTQKPYSKKDTMFEFLEQYVNDSMLLSSKEFENFTSYALGQDEKLSASHALDMPMYLDQFHSNSNHSGIQISTRKGQLWSTGKDISIQRGNLIHHYLEKLITQEDLSNVKELIHQSTTLSKDEKLELSSTCEKLIAHDEMKDYFNNKFKVLIERPIIDKNGFKFIPDRVVIYKDEVTIIDYKTGKPDISHKEQVDHYGILYDNMGYLVSSKVLVYLDTMTIIKW